ncbi:MAG: hypothetical protein IJ756_03275 [Paludibacteraceae bacterium]|nr:hypothetical protein [Paludibacteraceae bacterium]
MTTTLQELTDKLLQEGVEKGKQQADSILSRANHEAETIVENANKQAAEIIAKAEKQAAELDKNTRSELRLFAEQSVNALKTEVANLLTDKIASDSVKAATADSAFMQKIIADLAAQLAKNGQVVIETADAEALKKYFAANAKALLEKGVEIREVKGIKTKFTVAPKDGGYKLAFGDDEFIAYFKEFLRPQLVELLF